VKLNRVRQYLIAILILGFGGTLIELLLLKHYEGTWQIIPLAVIAAGILVTAWSALSPNEISRTAVRTVMICCVLSGAIGIGLHYSGNVEFQREIDPAVSGMELLKKVLQAKTPPALAPGSMAQLGLIGLVYAWLISTDRRDS
jgi:hypothetical protein